MADEQEAIAPDPGQETAPETPEIETSTTEEPERIPGPDEVTEGDETDQQVEDDLDDYEYDGKTFKAPRSLKEKLTQLDSMNKDYTTKSQANAERAKALEAREAQAEERLKVTDEELDARADLKTVDRELERFKSYDYAAYQQALQSDPLGATEAWNYLQHLKSQRADLQDKLGKTEQARTQAAQQDYAKRVEETRKFAQEKIKGWSPDLDQKLQQFALKEGVSQEFIQRNMSPLLYGLLHKAFVGEQTITRATAQKPIPSVPSVAPLATVGSGSSPASRVDLASADMDSYIAARKKGVGGKPLR